MQGPDYAILITYLVGLLGISLYLARKAAQGSEAYFLGGRSMPWWALGASGMSSNLDAAGTMTIITLLYTYGLHGFFIEMRGGVVLPIAVFLAFMGKWHQRSGVMTTAEWMRLRFGEGWQGRAARATAAVTYLVITIAMVVFFLAAAGKFLAVFLPFDPTACAVAMAVVALVYTMISGLYGVVWTDVFQAFLIGGAALYVAVRAFLVVDAELLASWPGAAFNDALPRLQDPDLAPYEFFFLFLLFWAGKGILEGLGGSGGSAYMAQRFYAAKDDLTCRKLSMLWAVLFAFRWPMVLGFAIIALHLGLGRDDPERILPLVLQSEFFPVGLRGLVVAAIFAASMSTFDSTINAGASYVVRDLVKPLLPGLHRRGEVTASYLASAFIVGLGLTLSLAFADSVVGVWTAIVIQLFPAFLVPFALRWFWGRFNGAGFTIGVTAGFAAAIGLSFLHLNEAATLGLIGGISLAFSIGGALLTPATDPATCRRFYEQIRPLGRWPAEWKRPHAREHHADLIRLPIALLWQLLTFLLPMLLVLHKWTSFLVLGVLYAGLSAWLLREVRRGAAGEA
ncbi:MAG: sodium:solute symporter [Verrucomicrobia bacterium]|jgi:Na+/proline symporter|nr:sodium:solute symporter [Verrucomicrobiota bacterium]